MPLIIVNIISNRQVDIKNVSMSYSLSRNEYDFNKPQNLNKCVIKIHNQLKPFFPSINIKISINKSTQGNALAT